MQNSKLSKIKKYFENRKKANKNAFIRNGLITILLFILLLFQVGISFLMSDVYPGTIAAIVGTLIAVISIAFSAFQLETLKIVDEQMIKLIENLEEEELK